MSAPPSSEPTTGRGLLIGRILGVPVYVSVAWLVMAVVLVVAYAPVVARRLPELSTGGVYLVAAGFMVMLFISVLLHELGHAVAALRLGIPVRAMTLWMLGGYTEMAHEPRSPKAEFLVSGAGPAVSVALGLLGLGGVAVLPDGSVGRELAVQLAYSNLAVAVFNLLPGLPLDGGGLVRAGVWVATRDRHRGTIAAGWAGRVIAVLVLAVAGYAYLRGNTSVTGLILALAVAGFLWLGASRAIAAGRFASRLPDLDARALAKPAVTVPAQTPLSEAVRRATEAGAAAIVITDGAGTPIGIVASHAADAVPEQRRPWIAAAGVARSLEPGMIIAAHLGGEDLLRALQACPASEYLVRDGTDVVGVLAATDVAHALESRGSSR